jgi:DNA modification methylase
MSIKIVDIKTVKPNPSNPRHIKDYKFTQLVKSIRHFPEMLQLRPIVVDADNIVLGGNMRLKACIEAGLKEVPIIVASELTDEQQKEFIIKDNVGFGEWDWEQLANEWEIEQLSDWGLDLPIEMEDTEIEAVEDNYQAPDTIETDIVIGDLFEIGEHRLLCGDSTDSDAVGRLMNGKKADMVFTDPPYGISYDSKDSKHEMILNDDTFLLEWMPQVLEHSKGFIFMWTSYQVVGKWISLTKDYFGDITNMIIWSKGGGGLGDLYKRFATDFEIALVWNRGETLKGKRIGSVWEIKKDNTSSYQHPTQKPIELMSEGLSNCSLVGNIIMDLFLGSGSTMVASHQLKRKCYGMELDPKYCQVIIDRMIKLEPDLKITRNGQPYESISQHD